MPLAVPPPEVAHAGLRALVSIARADGALHPLERDLLGAVQRFILRTEHDLDALEPIAAEDLAAAVPPAAAEFRQRIVHGCIFLTLIDGEAAPEETARVDAYAAALGVDDASLADLHRYVAGRHKLLRFDLLRRFILRDRLKKEWSERGLKGIWELARVAAKGSDPALAGRYQALEQLPRGTLGREYFEFIRGNEFSLPGEPGSPPELIVFHDCNHVLGDYGTTPLEESLIAAFHGGYRGEDKFGMLLFALMQFHLGVQITPTTGGLTGVLRPDLLLEHFERGAQVRTDLMAEWDPREDFERDLEELRRDLGVRPRREPRTDR